MNFLDIKKLTDFQIILDSDVYITKDSLLDNVLMNKEILENTWGISIFDIKSAQINEEDVLSFIKTLIVLRKKQVYKNIITGPITFYVWVDEMALQLRLNCISGCGRDLPFMCKTQRVESLKEITNIFFNLTMGIDENLEQDIEDDFCLKVFSECLNG